MFIGFIEVVILLQCNIVSCFDFQGCLMLLIVEIGGMNVMIVDLLVFIEQVVIDVLVFVFDSVGQCCFVLCVFCLQEEVVDYILIMLCGVMSECWMGNLGCLIIDIGLVIDVEVKENIECYIQVMCVKGCIVYQVVCENSEDVCEWCYGIFVLLMFIEFDSFDELKKEVFGLVLYVVCYNCNELDKLVEQINVFGYGLIFGVYICIDEIIVQVIGSVKVGNLYVNCNMVGVVVGVQLFGGEGLFGIGLKVGGLLYLYCLFFSCLQDVVGVIFVCQDVECLLDVQLKMLLEKLLQVLQQWVVGCFELQVLCQQYSEQV